MDDAAAAFGLVLDLAETAENQLRGRSVLESLIDRIYEAAGATKLWPEAIQSLGDYAGSDRCMLAVLPPAGTARWIASPNLKGRSSATISPSTSRIFGQEAKWHAHAQTQFIPDVDAAYFSCDGDFRHGDQPSWQIGTAIALPTGDLAIIIAERRAESGPFGAGTLSRLDAVRPHLVRACHLSAQRGSERARVTAAALDSIGLPAAVLNASGRVLAMNDRLQKNDEAVMPTHRGGLTLNNLMKNVPLQKVIYKIANGCSAAQVIPIRSDFDSRMLIAHVLRLEKHASDIFDASAMLLTLIQVGAPIAPDNALLHRLFELTPAEARLLQALAGGLRPQFYAESIGVKISTVRSQLKSIFNKTGTTRQAELVSIVASISAFGGYPAHC